MNQVAVLVVLLLVAYFGGVLRSQKGGIGMASGVEYVLLGIVLGPQLLGFLDQSSVEGFEPLLLMTLGWLAAGLGMGYGLSSGFRVARSHFLVGTVLSLVSCASVGAIAFQVSRVLGQQDLTLAGLVGLGVGAVGAGSGHHVVNWAMRKGDREDPLKRLLSGLGNVDDLPPLLVLSGLVVLAPPSTTLAWTGWEVAGAGLGLGPALGITVAALLGSRLRRSELWPVLLGAVLLVVGIVLRLGMPLLAPVFLFGLSVVSLSPHRVEIRRLVSATERPLFLPTLLLAGALVEFPRSTAEWLVALSALGARVILQFVGGLLLPVFFREARGHGVLLGRALLPASGASLAMGLVVYLTRPGEIGRVVLFVSVASTLLGEILGARALQRLAGSEQTGENLPLGIQEVR